MWIKSVLARLFAQRSTTTVTNHACAMPTPVQPFPVSASRPSNAKPPVEGRAPTSSAAEPWVGKAEERRSRDPQKHFDNMDKLRHLEATSTPEMVRHLEKKALAAAKIDKGRSLILSTDQERRNAIHLACRTGSLAAVKLVVEEKYHAAGSPGGGNRIRRLHFSVRSPSYRTRRTTTPVQHPRAYRPTSPVPES